MRKYIIQSTVRLAGIVCVLMLLKAAIIGSVDEDSKLIYAAGIFLWITSEIDWLRRSSGPGAV